MITKTQKYLLIGIPALVAVYLIFRKMMGKKNYQEAKQAIKPEPDSEEMFWEYGDYDVFITPSGVETSQAVSILGLSKYYVATLQSNLNVRESPSTSAKVVSSLPPYTIILAKPSSTDNWFEYYDCQNDCKLIGYVSASWVNPVNDQNLPVTVL